MCTTFTALEPLHAVEMTAFRALAYIVFTKSLEFTSFRTLAYTKFLDFTRNLSKLRVISRISFDLQSALPVRAKPASQAENADCERSQIVILGADLYKGTRQETSKNIHIIFEGRKNIVCKR